MKTILMVFNNAWVISIVTGVIVYFITNWMNKLKIIKTIRKI